MHRRWLSALAALSLLPIVGGASAQQVAVRPHIAVFAFELEDKSAGAGIIPPDKRDLQYLADSTAEAKRLLTEAGRLGVIDAPSGDDETKVLHGLRNCGGCEAKLAERMGAGFALIGVVTRVNRTEHTMFIRVLDARTGKPVAQAFSNLRMGANYGWPRTAKLLMNKNVLPAMAAQ